MSYNYITVIVVRPGTGTCGTTVVLELYNNIITGTVPVWYFYPGIFFNVHQNSFKKTK